MFNRPGRTPPGHNTSDMNKIEMIKLISLLPDEQEYNIFCSGEETTINIITPAVVLDVSTFSRWKKWLKEVDYNWWSDANLPCTPKMFDLFKQSKFFNL